MEHGSYRKSLIKYIVGFLASLVITFAAYIMVTGHYMMGVSLLVVLGVLALVQMAAQLIFFLHIGDDVWSRLRKASLGFMLLILLIVVVGSLWIMENLNYNMMHMSPEEKSNFMMIEKDKGF